jgi:hypothetical protein
VKTRFDEAVDCLAAIHAPVAGMLIRLARHQDLGATEKLQIRFFTQTARVLVHAAGVDARISQPLSVSPTPARAISCLWKLQEKTTELLAACARYPLDEALDKPASIATILALTHELCNSLGLEAK